MLSYRKSQQVSLTEKLKKKNVIHAFGVSGSGTTMARLCHSAFARVATLRPFSAAHGGTIFATAHSCGLRRSSTCGSLNAISLCHSAFVRVATQMRELTVPLLHLCHSAFVRVATQQEPEEYRQTHFATAHSCGLRLFECGRNCSKAGFATAHSCGLRPEKAKIFKRRFALPQHIRAGCDGRSHKQI